MIQQYLQKNKRVAIKSVYGGELLSGIIRRVNSDEVQIEFDDGYVSYGYLVEDVYLEVDGRFIKYLDCLSMIRDKKIDSLE